MKKPQAMKLTPVFVDIESFWSKTHTLKKMSPIEYCTHPETEIISLSAAFGDKPASCAFGEERIKAACSKIDWSDKLVVAHNLSGFDALILAWRLGIRPAMWGCTLAMARPIHAKTTGLSLAALVKHYAEELSAMGIKSVKDNYALINTQGKHLCDFTEAELRDMEEYNNNDTEQCRGIFKILKRHYTAKELWHIDTKIRGLVDPQFDLNIPLLETALSVERSEKHKTLLQVAKMLRPKADETSEWADQLFNWSDEQEVTEFVRGELASAPKFASLLESMGVEVPMKASPTNPDKRVPALAKTDEGFVELQEHENPTVAAAARARLAVKSTILETRLQAFIDAGNATGGRWPVTVHYCGADTTGRGSGWLYNPLNLPRVNPDKPRLSDALRNSIQAPKGHVVVVADLSGIEMRFNHFLWMVPYSTALWTADPKADLYRASAAKMYGIAPEQVDKLQRQFHKVLNLACGFGMGGHKFRATARTQGGIDLPVWFVEVDSLGNCIGDEFAVTGERRIAEAMATEKLALVRDEATDAVRGWRKVHEEIENGWQTCGEALRHIIAGHEVDIDPRGIFTTCKEGIRINGSGRLIRYPDLRIQQDEKTGKKQFVYAHGRHTTYIYSGKVDENLCQAGARDVIYDVAFEVFKATGRRPALEVYDELVYSVPEREAEDFLNLLQAEMRKPTPWFPDLVKWSEGDIASTYGAAK